MYRIAIIFFIAVTIQGTHSAPSVSGRIIGGWDIGIDKAPYQVSLQFEGSHICGGALVHKRYVVTAAHCVQNGTNKNYTVRVGTTYLEKDGDVINITKIIKHPDFLYKYLSYDVAVLQLKSKVNISDKVNIVNLTVQEPSGKMKLKVSGWGAIVSQGDPWNHLRMTSVEFIPTSFCKVLYKNLINITEEMFCAGDFKVNRDACRGDSGGPAVYKNFLVGITSFGKGCGNKKFPGVYFSIAKARKWIKSVIKNCQDDFKNSQTT